MHLICPTSLHEILVARGNQEDQDARARPTDQASPLACRLITRKADTGDLTNRISAVRRFSMWGGFDLVRGLLKPKVIKATVITATVTLLVVFLASNPLGWIMATLGVSLLAAKVIFASAVFLYTFLNLKLYELASGIEEPPIKQTLNFVGQARRLLPSKWWPLSKLPSKCLQQLEYYNTIQFDGWNKPENSGNLYLGALPNRLMMGGVNKALVADGRQGSVLSIHEKWEGEPRFLVVPRSDAHWDADPTINRARLDAPDHYLLTPAQMDAAADWIHGELTAERNVYVHCLAGVGRSATAIAAYLMKYGQDENNQPLSLEAICHRIQASRPVAQIWNKLVALQEYDEMLRDPLRSRQPLEVQRPPRSDVFNEEVRRLKNTPEQGRGAKPPKPSKDVIDQLKTTLPKSQDYDEIFGDFTSDALSGAKVWLNKNANQLAAALQRQERTAQTFMALGNRLSQNPQGCAALDPLTSVERQILKRRRKWMQLTVAAQRKIPASPTITPTSTSPDSDRRTPPDSPISEPDTALNTRLSRTY